MAPAAAVADGIALSQSPAAGAILLNGPGVSGGVATLDSPRRIIITQAGNNAGITFTVNGTNSTGSPLSETIAGGPPGVISTTQDFKTVTGVTHTGSVTSTITIGTSGVASSDWIVLNLAAPWTPLGIAVVVSGTINYTVEYTYDMFGKYFGNFPKAYSFSSGALTAKTADAEAGNTFNFPVAAVRLTVNSFTAPASARMILIQQGA